MIKQDAITQAVAEMMNIMQDPKRRYAFEEFKKKENQEIDPTLSLKTNTGLVNLS